MRKTERTYITITVANNTTKEEMNEIRQLLKKDNKYKDYTLNIIVSGNENFQNNLYNFIKAGIKP
jgi:protein involved in ribonucleotide reduction